MTQLDFIGFAAVSLGVACVMLRVLPAVAAARRIGRLAAAAVLAIVALAYPVAERAGQKAHLQLQEMVEGMTPTYAYELERMGHARITPDTRADDPTYLAMIEAQKEWLARNPAVADVYTFRKLEDGTTVLVVDSETDYDRNGRYEGEREARTQIGEVYDDVDVELDQAFGGTSTFSSEVGVDRWGAWVSAYVPMRDAAGRIEAVCGVDFPAEEWLAAAMASRALVFAELGVIELLILAAAFGVARARGESEARAAAARELATALDRAQAADEAKSQFLAAMSHELRTPLNGVLGMTELMLAEGAEPRQQRALATIQSSVQLLLTLIGGVLDFSKGREGRIQLDLVPGDLRAVASRAVEMLEGRAEQKGIALRFDAESDFPSALIFDPMRVQQVLMNLVGNAVKFTASGSVDVRLRRADASTGGSQVADRCRVSLSVRDTGIGIPARFLPKVFEPFTQADASTARHHGGTGLGLAICKQLVELMGGSIEIESEVGVGTEFRVHLSLEVAPAGVPLHSQMLPATASPALPRASGTPKILVVEDNRVNQEVALGVLARLGCSADVAASGREALEAVVKHAYDLVLLDGELPEMSGIEVARWIRAREREGLLPVYESGALPIVAVTAHALSEYRESCLAAGMNDYLTKPFTIAELASVIERNLPGVLVSASDPAGERAN